MYLTTTAITILACSLYCLDMSRKVALVAIDIRSSHNVGAFFRTADGFGCEIVLVGITPRPLGDKLDNRLPHIVKKAHHAIAKTALGAETKVKWSYFKTHEEAFKHLRQNHYQLYAVEQDEKATDIRTMPKNNNIGLVVGPEVTGLTSSILSECDGVLEIPMQGSKESFNVSVAAGIALYLAQ
jgi:23S rRNA (guanosine2251-2'-O)-methyltransferase